LHRGIIPVAPGSFRALARVAGPLYAGAHTGRRVRASVFERDRPRSHTKAKGKAMLRYAVAFLVISLVTALIGFSDLAAGAAQVAKVLFLIFLALFFVSLVLGFTRPRGG
jgi:uncharacterized membrane protein YtjA (UPF0391 family)